MDLKPPTITSTEVSEDKRTLTLAASDNRYIMGAIVTGKDKNGRDKKVYKAAIPNAEASMSVDISAFDVSLGVTGAVYDYAGNSTMFATTENAAAYTIESLKIKSAVGTEYKTAPTGTNFIAEVSVTKTAETDGADYFVVAVYGKEGNLISLNYAYASLNVGQQISYGINIPKVNEPVGKIRAYVWRGLSDMTPCAKMLEISE